MKDHSDHEDSSLSDSGLLEDLLIPHGAGYMLTVPARYTDSGELYQRYYSGPKFNDAMRDAARFDSPELRRMLWRRRHFEATWGDQKAPVGYSPGVGNRTGMAGIQFSPASHAARGGDMWTASGRDADGTQKMKRFSVRRCGFDTALLRAVRQRLEWRALTSETSQIPAEQWAAVVRAWHIRHFGQQFSLDRLVSAASEIDLVAPGRFEARQNGTVVAVAEHLPGEPLFETRLRAALPLLALDGVSFIFDIEGTPARQDSSSSPDEGPTL